MPVEISHETPASKGKHTTKRLKDKLKNLSKDEIGEYLEALEARLSALEKQ